ncbi:MAG: hypothetical protein ACLR06_08595 [Christensenellaceae bacterium]
MSATDKSENKEHKMELFGFIGTGNMGGALAEAVCRRLSPTR